MRIRNFLYSAHLLKSYSAEVPVISVGNITTGGTGKTPLVVWLCNYMQQKGIVCAILTRGYKTEAGQISDEPALLTKACPGTMVVVNPDRRAGAEKAISQHHAQVLVLDDGFQHRKLRRDLDIVAVDATCPFGYNRVLPAGLLREPKRGLRRASAVVITRFDQADEQQLGRLERQIHRYAPGIPIAKAAHKHTHAVTYSNAVLELDALRGKPVFAFCGIGNPNAFFDRLRQNSIRPTGTMTFNDHHLYTAQDMKQVFRRANACGAKAIVCTQKDWVKSALLAPESEDRVFAYLAMELDFLEGLDKITALIDNLLDKTMQTNGTAAT
jgi:tetraacyldisaccharide 4'-kinase